MKITNKINDIIYEKIESYGLDPHHYGDCNKINSTVACVYSKLGLHPILRTGYVELINPIFEDCGSEEYTIKHCWFSIDDIIYDFAASQLQELLDIYFNDSYFIGDNSSYKSVKEWNIDEFADNDLTNEILEEINLYNQTN